jgi:nicotinamide riboside kinase
MKIAISGAQSTGKTTLQDALLKEAAFKDYQRVNEVTRRVKSYGLPINEEGTDVTQRLIMQEHIVNIFLYDKFIADRSALDGVVYTAYLYKAGKVFKETLDFAEKVFERVQPLYDIQYFIMPEFEIENDGVRSVNVEFRDNIQSLFEEYVDRYNLTVVSLSGTVQDRVKQVLMTVNNPFVLGRKWKI